MDIIQHGKYHHNRIRIKCWKCDCIFDCSEYDLHDYSGISEKIYVNCPECNTWNDITRNRILKPV